MPTADLEAPLARAGERVAPAIDVNDHLDWARRKARAVARLYRLSGQECDDLVQTAYLALCRLAVAWRADRSPNPADPVRAFRGYAKWDIRSECRREAKRLRAGGTIRTTLPLFDSQGNPRSVVAEPASDLTTPAGDPFDPPARAGETPGADADRIPMGYARKCDAPDPPPAWVPYCVCPGDRCTCPDPDA